MPCVATQPASRRLSREISHWRAGEIRGASGREVHRVDGRKFDVWTRALSSGRSRRNVLKAAGAALIGVTGVSRGAGATRTLEVCHATGNPEQPYETMEVTRAELNLRLRQGDTLRIDCCADLDCAGSANGCMTGACDTGYCVQLPTAAGTPCEDGLDCTSDSVCDGTGSCSGSVTDCPETAPQCSDPVTCTTTADCPSGETCIRGACFITVSQYYCPYNPCVNVCTFFPYPESGNSDIKYCGDPQPSDFQPCEVSDECPPGTYCALSGSSYNGPFEQLCVSPCPTP